MIKALNVDDLLLAWNYKTAINWMEAELIKMFDGRFSGESKQCFCLKISRVRSDREL